MHLSDRADLRLKLHDLHILMTVVQAGSMSKAATLSQHNTAGGFQINRGLGTYDWRAAA
jgi:hypothetical protein